MTQNDPDFTQYSDEALKNAQRHLDAKFFPEEAKRLAAEVARRNGTELNVLEETKPAKNLYDKFLEALTDFILRTSTRIAFVTLFCGYLLFEIFLFYPQVTFAQTHKFVATPSH